MNKPFLMLSAALLSGLLSGGQAPTLRQVADSRGLLIGGAVSGALFDDLDPKYAEVAGREFGVVTSENAMKWQALESNQNYFLYGLADATVNWAQAHRIAVRGHTLIWHDSVPGWVYQIKDPQEMRDAMKNHIQSVMRHFGNKVLMWDVVNEAISDAPGNPLRGNSPFMLAGRDYIAQAFRWAHQANPRAKLYYNDYNVEGLNGKSDAMYALVKDLLARGVPIQGVGFQTHVDTNFWPPAADMQKNLQRFRDLGLDVQLTEVDVQLKGEGSEAQKFAQQAKVYGELMRTCLAVKCSAFIMWGVSDINSWRAGGRPLVFDDDYAKKPAYGALMKAMQEAKP